MLQQGARAKLMAVSVTAEDAVLMLEALQAGTHGIVLRTDSVAEVSQLAHSHNVSYSTAALQPHAPVMHQSTCTRYEPSWRFQCQSWSLDY